MADDYMFCVNTLQDLRKLPNELKGRNRVQRIVLFLHYTMIHSGFTPVFEDSKEESTNGGVGSSNKSPNNNNNKSNEQTKIKTGWNSATNSDVYSFQYSHPQLTSLVHLKMIPMQHLLLVHSTCSNTEDPSSLFSCEVNMNEYISEYMTENEAEYKWKALQQLFRNSIIYKLLPSLKPPSPSPSSNPPSYEIRGAVGNPLRISGDTPKVPFYAPFAPPSISPYNVGYSDLYPDFSGGGFGPGGGMEVGPNHAMFTNPPYRGNSPFHNDDDHDDFHFDPNVPPPYSPNHPLPNKPGLPPGPTPHFDPVGPFPPQNNKKDKRSPFGPDPDHLPMPGSNKDWYI